MGSISADKRKAVELAMGQIERQFGKGSIMKLGGQVLANVPVISTGSLALDRALGVEVKFYSNRIRLSPKPGNRSYESVCRWRWRGYYSRPAAGFSQRNYRWADNSEAAEDKSQERPK